MRTASTLLLLGATLTIATHAQAPSFRASIDYVELDVFVTDGNGAFVKDLAATDFEILEDGRPQTVERLSLVDIPIIPAASPPAGAAPFELDTATNAGADEGRLWVMLLDAPSDRSRGAVYTRRTQNAARQFIEQAMGPNDQMAVIHVQGTMRASQPLTRSRARLTAAVDSFSTGVASGGPDYPQAAGVPPFEQITRTRATFEVMRDVSRSLGEMSGRRKAILWVGGQMPFDLQNVAPSLLFEYRDTIRAAQRNNVVIYSVDPSGLGGNTLSYQSSLRIIAEDTGGVAIVNTNDFSRGFESIVRDPVHFVDRLELPKGRNEIRLAVRRPDGSIGSVVTYVDVPDFTSGRVAMSGLVLESGVASPPVLSGRDASPGDVAVTPTRVFGRDARVQVAGVLYRRANVPWERIALSAELRDAAGKPVRRDVEVVWRSSDAASLARGFSIDLPLANLAEGGHVLSVNARVDQGRRPIVSREVPFGVGS